MNIIAIIPIVHECPQRSQATAPQEAQNAFIQCDGAQLASTSTLDANGLDVGLPRFERANLLLSYD